MDGSSGAWQLMPGESGVIAWQALMTGRSPSGVLIGRAEASSNRRARAASRRESRARSNAIIADTSAAASELPDAAS